jgi:hypothetical protein
LLIKIKIVWTQGKEYPRRLFKRQIPLKLSKNIFNFYLLKDDSIKGFKSFYSFTSGYETNSAYLRKLIALNREYLVVRLRKTQKHQGALKILSRLIFK